MAYDLWREGSHVRFVMTTARILIVIFDVGRTRPVKSHFNDPSDEAFFLRGIAVITAPPASKDYIVYFFMPTRLMWASTMENDH